MEYKTNSLLGNLLSGKGFTIFKIKAILSIIFFLILTRIKKVVVFSFENYDKRNGFFDWPFLRTI